jgi:hypothetical protein
MSQKILTMDDETLGERKMEDMDDEDSAMDDNDESLPIAGQPPPPLAKRTKMYPNNITPNKWTDETTPLQVVQFYAREGVTEDQILKFFDEYQIKSLQKLLMNVALLGSIILRDTGGDLRDMVTAALNRSKHRPTEVLKGQLELDETCIDRRVLNLYASTAVSVSQSWVPDRVRYPNVTLVMGPSGSGKTMFCLQELPRQVFRQGTAMEEIFCLQQIPIRCFVSRESRWGISFECMSQWRRCLEITTTTW